jgi:hypothetical protein
MTLTVTLIILGVSMALTGLFGWMGARPKTPGKPQMVPWQFLMMLTAVVVLLMAVHLLNLVGLETGNRTR